MTKLNYATRHASGAKMGITASKDIQRRSAATIKGRGSAATKDPALELILCGKQLGDEGLQILCKALIETTAAGGVKIEELNLSDNELELSSLKHLGEVITVSPWLRDLDLSKNRILVETEDDIEQWTTFLQLFRNCSSMRLLDFSGNPMGDRAYEIFLRVYALEDPIAIPKAEAQWQRVLDFETSNLSDMEFDEGLVVSKLKDLKFDSSSSVSLPKMTTNRRNSNGSLHPLSSPSHQSSNAGSPGVAIMSSSPSSLPDSPISLPSLHGVQLRGLRSIPYLVFSDAGVTDAASLWLSYIVERHPFPSDLLPHLPLIKDGPQMAIFKALEEIPNCKGIIWANNSVMTPYGADLLQLAEKYRLKDSVDNDLDADDFFDDLSMVRSPSQESEPSTPASTPIKTRPGRSSTITKSPVSMRTRKGSGNFEHAQKDSLSDRQELEKARFKIESLILRTPKMIRPELWQTALRILVVARTIMFGYDDSIEHQDTENDTLSDEESIVGEENIVTPEMFQPSLDNIGENVYRLNAAKLDASSMPAATGLSTNTGLYSDIVRRNGGASVQEGGSKMVKSPRRNSRSSKKVLPMQQGSSPQGLGVTSVPNGSKKIPPPPGFDTAGQTHRHPPSRSVHHTSKAKSTTAGGSKESLISTIQPLPGNLPLHVWTRIITFAEDPRNLTSPTQRDNLFTYAQSKQTVANERLILGKKESVQIRKVLEQVEVLAYEI